MNEVKNTLYLIPFTTINNSFKSNRPLGMGVASTLAEILVHYQFPLSVLNYAPVDEDDPINLILNGNLKDSSFIIVGGYYQPDNITSLKLIALDTKQGKILDEQEFEFNENELKTQIISISAWLRKFGNGINDAGLNSNILDIPNTIAETNVLSRYSGLLWIIENVSSVVNKEFLEFLDSTMKFFENRIGNAYSDRHLRSILLSIVPQMLNKSKPEGDDPVVEMLGYLSDQFEPAGIEYIWPILEKGILQGSEAISYHACRGYIYLSLNDPVKALADFEFLHQNHPLSGWFALGRTYDVLEKWDEAIHSYNEAIKLTHPDDQFIDVAISQEVSYNFSGETWVGMVLLTKGRTEFRAKRFSDAEITLIDALKHSVNQITTLEYLSHVYRNWGISLLDADPTNARKLLYKHIDMLEEIFQIDPKIEDIEAAMGIAKFYQDESLEKKWDLRFLQLNTPNHVS